MLTRTICLPLLLLAASPALAKPLTLSFDEGCPSYSCGEKPYPLHTARVRKVTASSTLKHRAGRYRAAHIADGKAKTAWCEGASGDGIGQWVKLELARPERIAVVELTPFYARSRKVMFANGRVKRLRLEMQGLSREVRFSDQRPGQTFNRGQQLEYQHPYIDLKAEPSVGRAVRTSWVKLTILEVYRGARFRDTCLSELRLQAWGAGR